MSAQNRRLLIVSTVASTIRAFFLPYADHFRSLGWKVDGLSNGIAQCAVCAQHFDQVFHIEWSRRPLDMRNWASSYWKIRQLVKDGGYEIVHVHTPIAAFFTRLALAGLSGESAPVVIYTAHGFHFHPGGNRLRNLVFQTAELLAGRWTDYLVTINHTDESAALKLNLVGPGRLWYVPGVGVDFDRFSRNAVSAEPVQSVRDRYCISLETPIFVMIGEFIARKRHSDLLRAIAKMRNRNAHLILVGNGPEQPAINAMARVLGVLHRIHFAGTQEDVRPFILAAVATVLPSSHEGLPKSVMESLGCAVPVVGSNIRGTRDLLKDGGGLLFETGNVSELAAKLDWIVDHSEQALQMGVEGQRLVQQYGIRNVLAMHESLYGAAQKSPRRSAFRACCRIVTSATKPLAKRCLDVGLSLAALVTLSPLLALIAILVYLRMGLPLLFRQTRPGLHERPFTILKFRTMRVDRGASGSLLPDGERLTPFGSFLRRTSLDELPELWNVLKGDMSLVGPRPLLTQYLGRYDDFQRRRHEVKPGVTGWAQIHGRNRLAWEERFRLDVWYVDHQSFFWDLKILYRTIAIVLRRKSISWEGHATMPEFGLAAKSPDDCS